MLLQQSWNQRKPSLAILVSVGIALLVAGTGIAWWDRDNSYGVVHDDHSSSDSTQHEQPRMTPEEAFQRTWRRSDAPVEDGTVDRTWMWGPAPIAPDRNEKFAESPGGSRTVRYYDKSRMEITDPTTADQTSPWYVTNGLLVVDLVSGWFQIGVDSFEQHAPAEINVAGDQGSMNGPTYATIANVLAAPAQPDGSVITQRIDHTGTVTNDPALAAHAATASHRVRVTGVDHQVASPFWTFMQSSGPIEQDGVTVDGALFENPFYATGYPITEAYWATVRVAGTPRDVLLQCFERRCLTWTPTNPPGWQVESGNVGRHYFQWRYGDAPVPTTSPTASPPATATTSTPTPTATGSAVSPEPIAIGPGAVDAWMRSVVRDAEDRVWIIAMSNNAATAGTGPGELRVYRATSTGIPTTFEHLSALLVAATGIDRIAAADAAIDGENRLHIAWIDRGAAMQPLLYRVLDMSTGTWLQPADTIDSTNLAGYGGLQAQGGISLAVDLDGHLRVAYTVAGNHNHIRTRTLGPTGWEAARDPIKIDGAWIWHPALALAPDGTWYLAAYDATNRTILATRDTGIGWEPARVVASDVLGPENIDQSPSIIVTPAGVPTLTYLDGQSHLRVSQFDGAKWVDLPLGGDYHTHAPGLGVFADGTFVISGHNEGSPPTALNAIHGNGDSWGAWGPIAQIRADGSQVFRWAGAFSTPSSDVIDLVFFDEDTNDDSVFDDQTLYYLAVSRN